jgi:short-subunit dehydrogenase
MPRLQERARELEAKFRVETHIIQADLSTDAGCAAVEHYIANNQVDVLINNAGFGLNKAFTISALDAEQQMFDVLVRTPMRLMHVALPLMKQRNKGVIINVSSVAGYIAGGTYSAAKSYLTVLSESLHTELSGTNIKISALCPGFTRTEFHQRGRMSMKGLPSFMWLDSDKLVAKAWSDALKGEAVSIPGWQYQLLVFVIQTLPRSIIRKVGMNLRAKQRK